MEGRCWEGGRTENATVQTAAATARGLLNRPLTSLRCKQVKPQTKKAREFTTLTQWMINTAADQSQSPSVVLWGPGVWECVCVCVQERNQTHVTVSPPVVGRQSDSLQTLTWHLPLWELLHCDSHSLVCEEDPSPPPNRSCFCYLAKNCEKKGKKDSRSSMHVWLHNGVKAQ